MSRRHALLALAVAPAPAARADTGSASPCALEPLQARPGTGTVRKVPGRYPDVHAAVEAAEEVTVGAAVVRSTRCSDAAPCLHPPQPRATVAAMIELRLHVAGYPDSDEEERAQLASRLREDLRAQGLDEVAHASVPAPAGAKGSALEWAQLVVMLAGTAAPLLAALRGWRERHPRAAVTLELDGDRLVLDEASDADQRRLVEAFLQRHGAA